MKRSLNPVIRRLGPVLLLLAVLPPRIARGGAAEDEALQHYRSAAAHYEARDFEAALAAIEKAKALDPRPVYEGFRAWCIFRLGDQARGVRLLEALVASQGLRAAQRKELGAGLQRMRGRAGEAWLRVSSRGENTRVVLDGRRLDRPEVARPVSVLPGSHLLEITDSDGTQPYEVFVAEGETRALAHPAEGEVLLLGAPPGLSLWIDGKEIMGSGRLGAPVRVQPGRREVELRDRGGTVVLRRELRVRPGRRAELAVREEDLRLTSPGLRNANPGQRRWVGPVILGSSGVAVAVAGVALLVMAEKDATDLRDLSPGDDGRIHTLSQVGAFDLRERSERRRTAGIVLVSVGGAMVGGSLIWYLLDAPSAEPVSSSFSLGPGTVWLRGSF